MQKRAKGDTCEYSHSSPEILHNPGESPTMLLESITVLSTVRSERQFTEIAPPFWVAVLWLNKDPLIVAVMRSKREMAPPVP